MHASMKIGQAEKKKIVPSSMLHEFLVRWDSLCLSKRIMHVCVEEYFENFKYTIEITVLYIIILKSIQFKWVVLGNPCMPLAK